MRTTMRKAGLAVAALALAGGGIATTASTASATTADTGVRACITWKDSGGPGGAGRGHAKCAGMNVYVKATAKCADGSKHNSAWRWEYAKAECPYGTGIRSVSYQTKR
ncbi:hypothetical protein ACH4SP_07510 [Streptomyces sp. NPDC021093]|uniref:hypothetical protein n=1 Tax=Streptomyces sp. NPDC021093 TaxID=3365112 RepID=UPI0037B28C5C